MQVEFLLLISLSILQEDPEIKDAPNAKPLHFKGGTIEFKNVHFGYSLTC